jgi:peroxiredoxin
MALFACALTLFCCQGRAPAVGTKVADFAVVDSDGKKHSLDEYRGKKAVVIVLVGTECPIANLYFGTLAELHREYSNKGVQFLAINSNDQDSLPAVAKHAREHKVPFPTMKDVKHEAADALGAKRTPEAFLLDSGRVIRYRGRIDDQYGYTYRRPTPSKTELKDAIDAVLAGLPVVVSESEVRGCIIGRDKN